MGSGSIPICGKSQDAEVPKLINRMTVIQNIQQQTLKNLELYQSEKKQLEIKNSKFEKEIQELRPFRQKVNILESQNIQLKKKVDRLQMDKKILEDQISLEQMEKNRQLNYGIQINQILEQKQRFENQNQNFKREIQKLNEAKNEMENQIKDHLLYERDLNSRIFSFESERQRLYQQIQILAKGQEKFHNGDSSFSLEKQRIKKQKQMFQKEQQKFFQQKQFLGKELKIFEREKKNLTNEQFVFQIKIENYDKISQEFKNQKERFKKEFQKFQRQKEILEHNLKEIASQRQKLRLEQLNIQNNSVSLQDFIKTEKIIQKCLVKIEKFQDQQNLLIKTGIIPSNSIKREQGQIRKKESVKSQIQKQYQSLKQTIHINKNQKIYSAKQVKKSDYQQEQQNQVKFYQFRQKGIDRLMQ